MRGYFDRRRPLYRMGYVLPVIGLLVFLLLAGGCTPPSPTTPVPGDNSTPSPPTTAAPADTRLPAGYTYIDHPDSQTTTPGEGEFRLDSVIWGPLSMYLFGSASLGEGAWLKAYLYKDGEDVSWWTDQRTHLRDGRWEFRVKAGQYGAPEELPAFGPGYSLRITNTGNQVETAQLSLGVPGQPGETQIPGSEGTPLLELEGSRWQLSYIDDAKPLFDTKITLEFHEGKATGMSDCNYYGGGYVIKAPNLINIYELITTALSCGERSDRQADVYLGYLRNAICYRITDEYLEMYDVITNERTLVFERQP